MCTRVDVENDLPLEQGVQSDAGALDDVTVVPGADDITGMHVNMQHVTACSPHLLASKDRTTRRSSCQVAWGFTRWDTAKVCEGGYGDW